MKQPNMALKLESVLPKELADDLAYAFKSFEDACRAELEMHALTKSPAAHRMVMEHKVERSLKVRAAVDKAMKYLESRGAGLPVP